MAHQEEVSKVPVLVAPREQSVVRGDRVTFIWKPVSAAQAYTVQVAGEASFDEILYESGRLDRTEFTLRDELSSDDETYYWRVLVEDADGVVHGDDNIESFVGSTTAEVGLGIESPDQDEDFGPVGQLMRGAAAEAAAEVSLAPRWAEEEHDLGVEHEGVEAGQILGFILATAVALGLAIFTMFQYVGMTEQVARAEAVGRSGYPDLREIRLNASQRLTRYEVVDAAQARYRIPIDRAMELMANEARRATGTTYSAELDLGLGAPRPGAVDATTENSDQPD